ncbi:MAG TPA: hypothetical protein VFZ77_14755 [Acidimicrobiales bacterium]
MPRWTVLRPGPMRRVAVALLVLGLLVALLTSTRRGGRSGEPEDAARDVELREVDGRYPAGLPNDPAFFALGVWLETVHAPDQVALDRSFGLNLYVGLAHDDVADLDAIEAGPMHLLVQADEWSGDPRTGHPAIDGWLVYDEADLTYGPGWDDWNGTPGWNTCIPIQDEGGQCGYTVMEHFDELVPDGALRYANYGIGVLRFESDAEAEVFVNGGFQDVVSADDYHFTRPDATAQDRRGASYGANVDRIRALDGLDGVRQPVWAFVELGHPFSEDDAPTITAPQVRSAVWHSIIAGARGIVYFNHNFGGPCRTSSVLRTGCDPEMAPAVTELNAQVTELAPVLNAPFAQGYVTAEGPVEVMAKRGPDGAWYVFAGADTAGDDGGEATFGVAEGSTVEVLFEDRELPVQDGRFVDTFADGDAVHIYRVR